MGLQILTMTNQHPDFYRIMGPFLARRSIAKEMANGYPLEPFWDDDNKQWFVALQDGKLAGFATLQRHDAKILFNDAYVLPDYRRQGIHTLLITERLAHCPPGSLAQVLVCAASEKQYREQGFTFKRARGKVFVDLEKKIEAKDE